MFDVVFRLVTLFTATILFYYYSLMLLLALLIVLECCHKELKRKKRREFHQIPSHLESLLCNMNDNAKTTIIPLRKQNETHQRMTSMTMDVMKFFLSSVLYHSCFIRLVASSLTQFNVLLTVFLTVQCCCCFFFILYFNYVHVSSNCYFHRSFAFYFRCCCFLCVICRRVHSQLCSKIKCIICVNKTKVFIHFFSPF